jgi:hypothetical protein
MLPKSEAERLVRLSLLKGEPVQDTAAQAAAALAIAYHDDNAEGTAMSEDLRRYYAPLYGANPPGLVKWNAQRKVCFNLLRPIAGALCNTYEDPVRYVWSEEDDPGGKWAGMFSEFRDDHVAVMADADLYGWLGGTAGVRPLVTEDKGPLRYALYTRDQMSGTADAIDPAKLAQLVVAWKNGSGSARTETRHHWTEDGFFKTVDGKPHFDEWEEKAYPKGVHPYGEIPVILFHNRRPRWSCFDLAPMDLVNINRALNKKATELDWRMTLAGDVLFTKGYDSTEAPVVGAGAWINGGAEGSAEFLGPDPRVEEAVATMNEYLGKALMSRRIPENAIMARQSGESGIKVVADSAALTGFRKSRVNVLRPKEIRLIRLSLFCYAMHHGERVRSIEDVPAPSVFYTIPQQPMSADRRADWDRRIRLNLATPVDELLDLEPSLDKKQAEERIRLNTEYNAAAGLARMPGFAPGQRTSAAEIAAEEEADA